MKLYLRRQHWNKAKEIARAIAFESEKVLQPLMLATKEDLYPTITNNYITVANTENLIKYDTREMVELWVEVDGNFYYGQGTIKALDASRSLIVIETPRPLFDKNGENISERLPIA